MTESLQNVQSKPLPICHDCPSDTNVWYPLNKASPHKILSNARTGIYTANVPLGNVGNEHVVKCPSLVENAEFMNISVTSVACEIHGGSQNGV